MVWIFLTLLLFQICHSRLISFGSGIGGKLGDGNANAHVRSTPFVTNIQEGVNSVSTGESHSLALGASGRAYSFGDDQLGALCQNGTSTAFPTVISWFETRNIFISKLAAGAHFSVFLDNLGRVYTCGSGESGILGDNITSFHIRTTPYLVDISEQVIDIAVGSSHTLMVTASGAVLGMGFSQSAAFCNWTSVLPVPTLIIPPNQIGGISLISASSDFSLFLTTDGLYGCGSGTNYQACDFLQGSFASPTLIPTNGLNIVQISSGQTGTMILTDTGDVWVCGLGNQGQLGNGQTNLTYLSPLTRSVALNETLVGVTSRISLGISAAIISNGNQVFTVGTAYQGELGNGINNQTQSLVPFQVPISLARNERIISIEMGSEHALVGTAIIETSTTGIATTGGTPGCPNVTCLGILGNNQCEENSTFCPSSFCPEDTPFYCINGNVGRRSTCAFNPIECPLYACNIATCWDGSCINSQSECTPVNACPSGRPKRCPGYCVTATDQCPQICSEGQYACEDGSCVQSASECPRYHGCPVGKIQCLSGSCTSDICPTCPSANDQRCFDGTCQASCPEVRFMILPLEFSIVITNDQDNTIPVFSNTIPRTLLMTIFIPATAMGTPQATITIKQVPTSVSLGAQNPYWNDPTSTNIATPVIDISVTAGSLSFSTPVSLTFYGDYFSESSCLAYITSTNSWRCEDYTLELTSYPGTYAITGDTTHFTAFAVLFVGNEEDSSSQFDGISRPYYVIAIVFGILILAAGITAGILIMQKRKKRFQARKDVLQQQIEMYAK